MYQFDQEQQAAYEYIFSIVSFQHQPCSFLPRSMKCSPCLDSVKELLSIIYNTTLSTLYHSWSKLQVLRSEQWPV